jgi:insulysin
LKATTLCLWYGLVLSCSLPLIASRVIEDGCTLCVKTPCLAERKTLKLKLDNGLEAYLISDPGVTDAACALACDVGSWYNPAERPGLAHFVEHVVFLGNRAYPGESEFQTYIEENGGRTNAYTTDQYTAYIFSVQDTALEGALDRFSHFFISPLFNLDSMRREQRAVDEEFQRTIENDDRRQIMVLKALGNPDHPFSRFGAGNALTLGTTTSEEIRSWFESHYSADLMHLVVLSSSPLERLRSMVERCFERIPNRKVGPFKTSGCQFCERTKGQVLYVQPVQQLREVTLVWELSYDHLTDLQTHAADLVTFVLGHEGERSLLAQLKEEGLAQELRSGLMRLRNERSSTYLLMIDIDLTQGGLQACDHVIARCFQMLATLAAEGIPFYLQEELATTRRLAYEYQSRKQPFEAASSLIDALVQEDLATFPQRSLIPSQYDAEAVHAVLGQLTLDDCRIMITAPPAKTGFACTECERWLGVPYALRPVTEEEKREWQRLAPNVNLGIPPPNPFMPNDPKTYYRGDVRAVVPTPIEFSSDNHGIYFLAADQLYLVPEIAWRFRILSAAAHPGEPESAVLLDLLAMSIRERLAKTAYSAKAARLSFAIEPRPEGIDLAVDGCNEKALVLFEQIIEAFTDGVPTPEEFDRYREVLRKDYENFSCKEPIVQATTLMRHLLHAEDVTPAAKLKAVRQVSYQDLLLFFETFRDNTYVMGVLFGSMEPQEGWKVVEKVTKQLQRDPFLVAQHSLPGVLCMPEDKGPFSVAKRVRSQGNAVVLAVDQGPFSFKKRGAQQILAVAMEAPFFHELRTRQQTGYLVSSWSQEIEEHLFSFLGVQSNRYDGQELLARFELFLEQFLQGLDAGNFTLEKFETIRRTLIRQLQEPPKNPAEMGDLLATLAFDHDAKFDWLSRRIRGLQSLTYEEFVGLARDFLGRANRQRLAVVAEGHLADEPLKYRRVRSADQLKQMSFYRTRREIAVAH